MVVGPGTPKARNLRRTIVIGAVLAVLAGSGAWWLARQDKGPKAAIPKGGGGVSVTTAAVERRDVPVRLRANGTVVALQSVDIRAQITSTVSEVHIREGQFVRRGDLLVSLDARAEEANVRKAEAQVEKDRADIANAQRTLERQRQLFAQKFISQSALDAAQNAVETLKGQLAVDLAAVEAAKVALGNTRIHASFPGRTGVIAVRPGSLVQPAGTPVVTVTQMDPIQVSFALPEQELAGLKRALVAGRVAVTVRLEGDAQPVEGAITFVDNAVEAATGTIRVKADFANGAGRLWPGMYVAVELAPRTIEGALVVPAQAVQTGPENRFVFVVGPERKVAAKPVRVALVAEGIAVVQGVEAGERVVIEGAQNLRPGATVTVAGAPGAGDPKPMESQ